MDSKSVKEPAGLLFNNLTKSPQVSVVMNCLNGAKYLREALDSVFAQTYKDWEIIFWDNASRDNSAEIARSYGERVRYFRSDETYTLGKARNYAINEAKGKYLAFLDCDDIWMPDKLEKQIPLLERKSESGLVYCDAVYFNDRGYSRPLYGRSKPPEGRVFELLLTNYFLCMSTVVINYSALQRLDHRFDPEFSAIEEADLFIRIARDWKICYAPFVLTKYRMHANNTSFSLPKLFPKEWELLMTKYKATYPDFTKIYEEKLKSQIQYTYARIEWEQGNNLTGRNKIKPIIFVNLRYLLAYFAMFFPYRFIISLRRLFSNSKALQDY